MTTQENPGIKPYKKEQQPAKKKREYLDVERWGGRGRKGKKRLAKGGRDLAPQSFPWSSVEGAAEEAIRF